jgi:hypothetical protein
MHRAHDVFVAAITVSVLALGCGGVTVSGSRSPASDDGGTVCPAALPTLGASCETEGLEREYGAASWNVSCDTVVECEGGKWSTDQPSLGPCTPKPGPNSAACPASYSSVPLGASCDSQLLSCAYDEGVCVCQGEFEVPPALPDGGASAPTYWACNPGQGCPFPRPPLGTSCAHEAISCQYVACTYAQSCTGGVWHGVEDGCAQP